MSRHTDYHAPPLFEPGPSPERWAFGPELDAEVAAIRSQVPGATDADVAETIRRCREERERLVREKRPDCSSPTIVVLMAVVKERTR